MKKCLAALAALMLTACLGMETKIDIKQDGNGTIDMTYRVSDELFSLGTLSGNENSPPVPVGREDFERTFSRIPGTEMVSYSEKTDDRDRFFLVKAKFDSLEALVSLLDGQGRQVSLEREGGRTALFIRFDIDDEAVDPDLAPLLPVIFENYYMDFSVSLPRSCNVRYIGEDGGERPSLTYGETTISAKNVVSHSPMANLFTEGEAAAIVISW
jgi:hypothetical protein